ncbi:putative Ig domain-containing protein [Gynuella sunshinyii]|uniref:putative Ig domain-containing protein n=1 Tax=Gynuella sunshinyii TaxID=1445505 RepID=UPI000AC4E3FC|nr:putative Ig domain-containing protein [Gynuella sunshinyii]
MTKIVTLPLILLTSVLTAFSSFAEDFGVAQPYNALVFGDFTAAASDVEGRLAAGGNISLTSYAIGQLVKTAPPDAVLVAGGDIHFSNGKAYHGNILAAGSTDDISESVRYSMAEGASIVAGASLPIDFAEAEAELTQLSADLAALEANTEVKFQWGGLYMTAACDATTQVFQLDGNQVLAANTFKVDLSCAPADATYVFNIDGAATGMTNMGLQSLESVRNHVVYNFYQATSLTLQSVGVEGSVLAPLAHLENPAGVIKGQLFARSWNGPMQINQVPFAGDLPVSNEPPVIISTPVTATPEQSTYKYQLEVTDPDEDPISYSLDLAPAGMSIDGTTGLISWLPQSRYVQTVPTFNNQCYVVPTGAVKVYEDGDETSSLSYIAPLFHRVREAIAQGSLFVAPAAVDWHKTNNCLGCHIQTQTLLGLQSSLDKADVDEEVATYLLNEIINSQLSDGAIRRSHPEYAKNQTAFALWALSFVPDRAVTFDARAKALNFLWGRKQSSSNSIYWTNDHSSGWLNNADSMTALVALGASRYILDALEQDSLSVEQQTVMDQYSNALDSIAEFILGRTHLNEDTNLPNALRLVALGELYEVLSQLTPDDDRLISIAADMHDLDVLLRNRQEDDGGWGMRASGTVSDPLPSAWVGLALNYLNPDLTDKAVLDNIEYLLSSQQPDGTWITNSGLFTTRLATTSLVMSYLPVALEHLGNPDVSAGHILLTEGEGGLDTLSAVIRNRGLADITVPVMVNFYNGVPENNELLGSVQLDQIASNQSLQPSITVSDAELTDDIYVTLTVSAEADECDITNNQTVAALVRVRATDPGQLFDTQVYTLNVDDVNQAPVITSEPPIEWQSGQSFNYQITSTDVDIADAHSYALIQGPEGLYLDPHTGQFTSAPGGIEPGTYTVTVQVTDLRGESTEQTFTVVVHANLPPQITSTAVIRGNDDSGYRYDVEATDPNAGDVLRYTYSQGPGGLDIDASSGLLQWGNVAASLVEGRTDTNQFCVGEPETIERTLLPVVKWHYQVTNEKYPQSNQVMHAPIAVPLYDTNNDGRVDADDDIAIIFQTFTGSNYNGTGYLRAIWAKDGSYIWTADTPVNAVSSPAAADIDHDGNIEIVTGLYGGGLVAFSHEGNVKWKRANSQLSPQWGGVSFADMDGDGETEIVIGNSVLDSSGNLLWKAANAPSGTSGIGPLSYAVDINMDGYQELIVGAGIYRYDGQLIANGGEGLSAIGNFDDDEYPEIVRVYNGSVYLHDQDASVIWSKALPGGGRGGAPTVADLTGDGIPEIGVAGAAYYSVFDAAGNILWSSPTTDRSSNVTGSSVFDFNADGRAEIVYADERYLRVYDGLTGDVIYQLENGSGTTYELPVIADVDHDNHAEIILISNNYAYGSVRGIRMIEDANDSWAPTRTIWNQHAYHIDNINDDLTIPAHPVNGWLTHNTFRLNTFPDRPALGLADLTVHSIAYDEDTQTLTAWVKNRGLASVDEPVTVNFVHEHFWTGDEALGQVTIDHLEIGEEVPVSLTVDGSLLQYNVRVDVHSPDTVVECLTENNSARAAMIDARVYDEAGLYDSQVFAASIAEAKNSAPVIVSSASSQAIVGEDYRFQIEVSDADRGDDAQFSLVGAPESLSIGSYSGVMTAKDLADGIYTFTIRATDLSGEVAEQLHILTVSPADNHAPTFESEPVTTVKTGQVYGYDVIATDPDGDELIYLLSRSQPGMTIDGETGQIRWTPGNQEAGVKSVEVTVMDTHGAASKQYFLIDVTDANADNQPPVITSVPSGVVYAGQNFEYQVQANDPDGDALTYTLGSSSTGMAISSTGLFSWLPSSELVGQSVVVEIQVDDGKGGMATQKLTLPVNESANHAPVISSLPELTAYADASYLYTVEANDQDGDAIHFQLLEAPNGMMLNGNVVNWTPSSKQAGSVYEVAIKATDARGAASTQTFAIAVNHAVQANATPNIASQPTSPALVGEEYGYDVVARDADGDALTFALLAAPDGMTLSDTGALRWTATSDQVGSHAISLSVTDGQAMVTQSYTLEAVEATADNSYPEITSYPSTTAVVEQFYSYPFSATDADGDVLTYGILTGPDGMTMDVSGLLQWTPTTDQVGSHDVVLYADDGQGRSLQSYSIAVSAEALPLSATILISPEAVNPGDTVVINVFTSGGTGSSSSTLWVDDTEVALNAYGQAEIVTSATDAGIHSVSVQVSDGTTTVLEASSYSVRVPQDNNAPVVSLNAPDIDSIISAPADVIGSVSDDNLYRYRVMISPKGQQAWQTIAEGSSNVSDAKVATLDPTMLINGQYDIVLYAEDVNGHTASDSTVIGVEGDLKVGNFSITLEDLNIPMAGIPIRLTRTYDSRRRFEDLDFGYGWSVGYQDVKVEESRTIGKFWSVNQYKRGPFNLIVDFCVEPQGAPVVTITLPTGDVERFEAAASPSCSTYQVINNVDLKFNPVGDTQSTLTALDDSSAYYSGGLLLETGYFSSPVDPDRYKLTTQSGYEYYLNQDFGIDKVVDPNGNTLTYTNNGIFHSSGKAITFNRDSKGRITSITDPNGHRLEYRYDNSGNLTVSEDALDAQTTYVYNRSHGLLDLVDPLGRTLIKNIYDDDGRLIAQEDNDGQRIDFNHDIAGRESVVSDRNGHTTFYYYDDMGNVTTRIDAAGETWEYRYDEHGNQLSETDPLGNVTEATFDADNNQLTQTDALGNTITYAYNSRGQETEITDALGNVYKNTYDSIGNLLMVTDPLGNIAGNNINKKGLVSKTTDALKNVTEYTYDSDGNKLTETRILATATTATDGGSTGNAGAVTTYTYDDNGNVLTETNAAGNTTTYVYDARNRVIETHYADGSVSQNEYDLAGQLIATIDALGHRTEMDYDAYGRVTETRYPDGTWEANTYDSEGNRLSTTDRLGQMTIYHYDALNRVIQTDLADGSSTYTSYDAVGRVISETDALGHITQYEYDAAGRRTAVINALDHRHSFAYDANGNLSVRPTPMAIPHATTTTLWISAPKPPMPMAPVKAMSTMRWVDGPAIPIRQVSQQTTVMMPWVTDQRD